MINKRPIFNYPSFNSFKDIINTNLMIQLVDQGMSLDSFNKNVDNFIRNNIVNLTYHREFIKVLYDHSATYGCDKTMKGISLIINNSYKVEETCGTNPLRIDTT